MTSAHHCSRLHILTYAVSASLRLSRRIHVLQIGVPKDTLGNNLPKHRGYSGFTVRQGMIASQSANLALHTCSDWPNSPLFLTHSMTNFVIIQAGCLPWSSARFSLLSQTLRLAQRIKVSYPTADSFSYRRFRVLVKSDEGDHYF